MVVASIMYEDDAAGLGGSRPAPNLLEAKVVVRVEDGQVRFGENFGRWGLFWRKFVTWLREKR